MKTRRFTLILAAATASVGVACSDDPASSATHDAGATVTDATTADTDVGFADATTDGGDVRQANSTLTGRVDQTDKAVQGATVLAFTVDARGNVSPIDGAEATTDATGRYAMAIAAEAATDILVRATDGDRVGEAIVVGGVDAAGETVAPPIDMETTVEANVAIRARADGEWCTACTTADITARVSSEMANAVAEAGYVEGELDALVEATMAAGESERHALTADAVGHAESDVDALIAARAAAYSELSAALDAASTETEAANARELYAEALSDARASIGIAAETTALASRAEAEVFARSAAEMSGPSRARAIVDAELRAAADATAAMEAAVADDGSEAALAQARGELMGSIEAAVDAGNVEEAVQSAWAEYRAAVEAQVTAELDATAAAAWTTFSAGIDAAGATYGDAVEAIEVTLGLTGEAAATVQACLAFDAAVETSADALVEAGVFGTQAEASSVASAMATVAMGAN